jgi:protein regulator of cytokinesis 1
MTEEARRLTKTIKQMEASLDDIKSNSAYDLEDSDTKITYPLTRCLQSLKEKYNVVSKLHRERFAQVKSTYMLSASSLHC